jgi:outer membrane protein TolC
MNPARLSALLLTILSASPAILCAVENVALPERLLPELDRILQEAVQQSPAMLLRNLDLEIARGDEMQAKAGLYPNAGGYLSYQESRESREGLPSSFNTTILNYSLSVTQPIWRWGTVSNNARIGEIRRQIAGHQYEEGFRLLARQIRSAYLNLIVNRAAADQAEFSQKLAQDTLRTAEDRLAKGATSGGEVFQVQMAAQQARLSADRAAEDLHQALISFRHLTGRATFDVAQIPGEIPLIDGGEDVPPRLLADFLSQKEPENLDTIILRKQLETESLNLKIQRKRLYPMFNLVAGVTQSRQNYTLSSVQLYRVEDRYVGVNLNWSIFDGYSTRGAVVSSLARKRQLEARYRDLTQNLAEDAQRQAKQTEFALRQMRIYDRWFDDRGNFLRSREEDFKRGTASEADLNSARAGYNQSQITAFLSRAGYLMQMCDFLGVIREDPVLERVKVGHHE